jgi:hypothetical protein
LTVRDVRPSNSISAGQKKKKMRPEKKNQI